MPVARRTNSAEFDARSLGAQSPIGSDAPIDIAPFVITFLADHVLQRVHFVVVVVVVIATQVRAPVIL